ncbi:MAG: tyrosine-type recombinase/integrase [Candidatus Dormibacteria bacterium]
MHDDRDDAVDLAFLKVPQVGSVRAGRDLWEPFQLVDRDGTAVQAVSEYLKDLQAGGRAVLTQRSYAMDLLRWFRFLWAIDVAWDQATRSEARDFSRWLQVADRPARPHWRSQGVAPASGLASASGRKYGSATRAHSETVLRHFYDFHLEVGTGPMVNPFPLARARHGERPGAHHNPMDPNLNHRSGLFRPRLGQRIPRSIPDERFNELFAGLSCDRDRALVAFWISTGARALELLGASRGDADPGRQLITVVRKGTRESQDLPASPDAFVWLRLYQAEMDALVPTGPDVPLWWTLRRPFRALAYHAARAMFVRASAATGASWTLHNLRHSAAYRMARDPDMPLTDVQWVLGHARLSTTQLYVVAPLEDVVESVLAHHRRQRDQAARPEPPPQSGYRPETLEVLFGRRPTR